VERLFSLMRFFGPAPAAMLLALASASPIRADGAVPAARPVPEHWVRVQVAPKGRPALDVDGWLQYGRPDSVDLVPPARPIARWDRIEAHVAAEALVLHAHGSGRYRVEVPRGALLQWTYTAQFATADTVPQSFGNDHACVYMGGMLLDPVRPGTDEPAAERFLVDAYALPTGWRAVGPWRTHDKVLRPRDARDLRENFAAWGRWRTHSRVVTASAGACTLQVAATGGLSDSLAAGTEDALAAHFGPGRALVVLVPSPGAARAFTASRSAMVRLPKTGPLAENWSAAWAARRAAEPTP
jgi:hypothetical protein